MVRVRVRVRAGAREWIICTFFFPLVIGASLSEPHTSESNGGIFIYILYICRTSFRKCKFTLLTRNIAHAEFKVRTEY